MKVDQFDFDLPAERIALRPARPRDAARLLIVEGGRLSDRGVADLADLLRPEDVLVFNDTRVIRAQLEGVRGAARVGVTLHKRAGRSAPASNAQFWSPRRSSILATTGAKLTFSARSLILSKQGTADDHPPTHRRLPGNL